MDKYFSKHPIIFLISFGLVVCCCLGGILTVAQLERVPIEATVTATEPATATVVVILEETSGATPSVEIIIPTASNTGIPENTATSQPATPSPTVEGIDTQSTNRLVVHVIDVGHGDAILVVSPEGLTALIDGGSADPGVVDYLWGQGVEGIDLMIATHPHEDHIGGLIQVLEEMPVARVVTNGQPHSPGTYEDFLDAILGSAAEYSEAQRGDTIALGEMEFSVLNPGENLGGDLNENSMVLRLVYGQTTMLFMGDAGMEAEASMMAAGLNLKADILKVGHHGSCSGTSPSFLQAVQPEVGIYTAGVDKQDGLPCAETIYVLNQREIFVLGTDVNGSIIITVTGDGYRITDAAGKVLKR